MGSPNRKITVPYVETVNKALCRYECRYDGHCFIHTRTCAWTFHLTVSSLVGSPRRDSCPADTDERPMNRSANSYRTPPEKATPPKSIEPSFSTLSCATRRNPVSLCITNPGPPLPIKPWRQGLTCKVPLIHILYYAIIPRLSRPPIRSFRCKTG